MKDNYCVNCGGQLENNGFCSQCGLKNPPRDKMKQIEYQIVPLSQKLRKNVDDKKFLQEWQEILEKWGSAGWELIKVVPTTYFKTSGAIFGGAELIMMQRFLLIFKREI